MFIAGPVRGYAGQSLWDWWKLPSYVDPRYTDYARANASIGVNGAVSLPGEVSFISAIAPIAMALGVPIAPLALLVAVEMIPDIFRTVGNVMFDVVLATVVDRSAAARSAS